MARIDCTGIQDRVGRFIVPKSQDLRYVLAHDLGGNVLDVFSPIFRNG
jgi:hypothetical protein